MGITLATKFPEATNKNQPGITLPEGKTPKQTEEWPSLPTPAVGIATPAASEHATAEGKEAQVNAAKPSSSSQVNDDKANTQKFEGQPHAQRRLDLEKPVADTKLWAGPLGANTYAAKGMTLNFIAQKIQDGVKIVELDRDEVEAESEKWNKAIIFYVVGDSPTNWGC